MKTKRIFALAITILLTTSLLTSCGSSNASSSNTTSRPSIDINVALAFVQREVEIPDEILDLDDDSIYFLIIDGVKFDLTTATVQDFLDAGFRFYNKNKYENREVEPQGRAEPVENDLHGYINITKGDMYQAIAIYAENLTDKPVSVNDCRVTAVHCSIFAMLDSVSSMGLDISIVCNLGISYLGKNEEGENEFGVAYEKDVINVFGDKYPSEPNLIFIDNMKTGVENRSFIFTRTDIEDEFIFGVTIRYGGEYYFNQGDHYAS